MRTFLIAHTDHNGLNAAQARVAAKSVGNARDLFKELYPEREIVAVGELGRESL